MTKKLAKDRNKYLIEKIFSIFMNSARFCWNISNAITPILLYNLIITLVPEMKSALLYNIIFFGFIYKVLIAIFELINIEFYFIGRKL